MSGRGAGNISAMRLGIDAIAFPGEGGGQQKFTNSRAQGGLISSNP